MGVLIFVLMNLLQRWIYGGMKQYCWIFGGRNMPPPPPPSPNEYVVIHELCFGPIGKQRILDVLTLHGDCDFVVLQYRRLSFIPITVDYREMRSNYNQIYLRAIANPNITFHNWWVREHRIIDIDIEYFLYFCHWTTCDCCVCIV